MFFKKSRKYIEFLQLCCGIISGAFWGLNFYPADKYDFFSVVNFFLALSLLRDNDLSLTKTE